jgi:hypothetical protein
VSAAVWALLKFLGSWACWYKCDSNSSGVIGSGAFNIVLGTGCCFHH